jgi:Uma2 family endonuclease
VLSVLLPPLSTYLNGSEVGRALMSPSDVRSGPRRFVQPDLFVVRYDALKARRYPFAFSDLLLSVEALSPATARRDWHDKRRVYLAEGVPEYWIVDNDARSVARWRPGEERPEILVEQLVWHPAGMPAPLIVELPALFRKALDFA